MGITVNINSGKDYEKLPEGVFPAVLADIVDLGVQDTQYGPKEKVRLVWLTNQVDSEGHTMRAFETFTKSLHEKAGLRKRVDPIIKANNLAPIPDKGTYDLDALLGINRRLVIQHNESAKGDVYANVTSTLTPDPGQTIRIPSDFKRKEASKG